MGLLVGGLMAVGGGTLGEIGGVTVSATGIGAAVGVPAVVAGAVAQANGATAIVAGAAQLLDALNSHHSFSTGQGLGGSGTLKGGWGSASGAGKAPGQQVSTNPQKSIESLRGRIAEHTEKLNAYKANPGAFDDKGFLQNAPSADVRRRIIDGRVRHLENEIRAFEKAIRDIGGEP